MKKKGLLIIAGFTFFLGSCGSNTGNNATSGAATSAPASGQAIYNKTCITCHQANGEGLPNAFPPLAKSDYLSNKGKAILQVLKGSAGELVVNGKTFNSVMPPQQLTDEEIASVLTYVYSSFGNSGDAVTTADVKGIRAKL